MPAITADEVSRLNEGKTIKFQCVKTGCELYEKKHLAYGTGGRKKVYRGKSKKTRVRKRGSADDDEDAKQDEENVDGEEGEDGEDGDESFKSAQTGGNMNQDSMLLPENGDSSDDELLASAVNKAWL